MSWQYCWCCLEQVGIAAFEFVEEGVGVGLAEDDPDPAEKLGGAAEGLVKAVDEVAGQLAPGDPAVDLIVAAEGFEGVVGGELGQG